MSPRWLPLLAFVVLAPFHSSGEPPRALPPGQTPEDRRLGPFKELDGYFPFSVPESREAWEHRAERVRRQILVTLGLWPMPSRSPLNAVIHGRRDQGDYTVEKVYFESAPGFFVTGNLYRPKGKQGRLPGVLCPHGHWPNGRFMDLGEEFARQEIATGAERFENGGRSVLQARCATLARMGCVVFHYDLLGYADSQQFPMSRVHGFDRQRPDPTDWGLFSPQAETWFQSAMGLQTWNSIRALDFLESLPDVDPARIGATAASGGATEVLILCAIDDRPAVAFLAVMVSTAMQSGCMCKNACGLRINTGNVEFAALFAPKPLGLTSANDWTIDMPTKGYPELQRLYELLGAKDHVSLRHLPHFGHNYNYVSRTAMYHWFNRHLGLGLKEPILEQDYPRLTAAELTVWDEDHPKPDGGDAFEHRLLQWWTRDATEQLAKATATEEGWRKVIQPAIEIVIGRTLDDVGPVDWDLKVKRDHGSWLEMAGLLHARDHGESVPVIFLHPRESSSTTVIMPTASGMAGLYQGDKPRPEVSRLLDQGVTVMGLDLLYQGESLADGSPLEKTRRVRNPREAAAYTFGYNHTVFQQRVHDLLTAISFVRNHENAPDRIRLMAGPDAGHWAACAEAVAGDAVRDSAIEIGEFRFAQVRDIHSPDFVPGGAKFLDPFVLENRRGGGR